jgi:hypothetical protein
MKWIILIAIIAGVIWIAKRSKSTSAKPRLPQNTRDQNKSVSKTYVTREGQAMEADDAFHAWTSGNLDEMVRALKTKTNLIDRHFLLMSIVDQAYKNRSDPDSADLLRKVAEMHVSEFPQIKPALKKEMDGILPRVTTFQKYATFLTDNKEYEKALQICEQAISEGLHDGTKSGFEGRIKRIKRKTAV